jgi:hypothetical protein
MLDISQYVRHLENDLLDNYDMMHFFDHGDAQQTKISIGTKIVVIVEYIVKEANTLNVSKVVERTIELISEFSR